MCQTMDRIGVATRQEEEATVSNTLIFGMYADDTSIYFNTEDFPTFKLVKHIYSDRKEGGAV